MRENAPPEHAVAAALAEIASLLIRLRPRDMSLTAEVVLSWLERNGAGRVGDLAALAAVSQPTMTELLVRLERDGLLDRAPDPDDRRALRVTITDTGRGLLGSRREKRIQQLLVFLRPLPADQAAALLDAFAALRGIVAAAEGAAQGR